MSPRRKRSEQWYAASESFIWEADNGNVTITVGQLVQPEHPILAEHGDLFQPADPPEDPE